MLGLQGDIYIPGRKERQKSSRDRWDQSVRPLTDVGPCADRRAESPLLLLARLGIFLSVASIRDHIRIGRTLLPESAASPSSASQPDFCLVDRTTSVTSGTIATIGDLPKFAYTSYSSTFGAMSASPR